MADTIMTTDELARIIVDLKRQHRALDETDQELERTRRKHAFAATQGDKDAAAELDRVGEGKRRLTDQRTVIAAALNEANARFGEASAAEARTAETRRARDASEKAAVAIEAAGTVDEKAVDYVKALLRYNELSRDAARAIRDTWGEDGSGFSGISDPTAASSGMSVWMDALRAAGWNDQRVGIHGTGKSATEIAAQHLQLSPPAKKLLAGT